MSSSSSSSSVSQQKYDVFLSFRGEDTRKKFTDHLYAAFERKGIITFRDDPNLEAGKEIAPELLKAIQESWCSVIVFSKTYAFSSWCLEELSAIIQQKKDRDHRVFAIFYDVDPSDLRYRKGEVKEAFAKHEERYKENKDMIQRWRDALTEVANVKGWHYNDSYEATFIEDIAEAIYSVVPLIEPIFASKDFMHSKSSTLAFNQIMKALNTNGVNMIGLYGMPGVGNKTTLATEVAKHVKEKKLFDNVVIVTMSQTPDIDKIQDRIAEKLLRTNLQAKTKEGKKEELWRRLKDLKNIFIIIDDVWEGFDLQIICIPISRVKHQGWKFLLTMRDKKVCLQMYCQKIIQLNVLSEEEGWALLKAQAKLKDVSSKLNDVAKEVASECKGLPLAIVTVGKALIREHLDGWIAANKRFKDSRHSDNKEVCKEVYKSLQLSYHYLEENNIQSCFLLCSLFPEDWWIDTDLLTTFAIGEGLFSDTYSLNDVRREIQVTLRKLHQSGLLLKTDGGFDNDDDDEVKDIDVKMHDVVREFAHWITSKGENMLMVKEGLAEWPISKRFGCCSAICFWNNSINNFPDNLEFSKLKILVFEGRKISSMGVSLSFFDSLVRVRVPGVFIAGMKALRVLNLEYVICSLEAFEFLRNLQCLSFKSCEIENISSLRNVENLEILKLLDTNISELPEELVELRRLKSLDICCSHCETLKFPPNLLSRMTSLQELKESLGNNIKISELNSLSRLTTLALSVSTSQCFPENCVFPKLETYNICVNLIAPSALHSEIRSLKFHNFSSSFKAFKELFCNVNKLFLNEVKEHKNIVPSVDREGLNELTCPLVQSCHDMKYLIDTTGGEGLTTAFSKLVSLRVERMGCLKELWHGPPPLLSNLTKLCLCSLPELDSIWKLHPSPQYHVSLRSLKNVTIRECHKLKSIFSNCFAQSLLHLEVLEVCVCDGLEQAFDFPPKMGELEENHIPPISNLTYLDLRSLPKLMCIWKRPTHRVNLHSLRTMNIINCSELAYLFPTLLAKSLLNLEKLQISMCDSLEHVIVNEAVQNGDGLVSNMDGYSLCWPKLKTLQIYDCGSLKYVFPITWAQGLPNLESIEISSCSQLKQVIFNVAKVENGVDDAIALPRLQHLRLERLMNLSCFCPENYPIASPSLETLIVKVCPLLENFAIQQVQKEVQLQENKITPFSKFTCLELVSLPKLRCIWKGPTHLVNLHSLRTMKISYCSELEYLFPTLLAKGLLNLEELHIRECDSLEHVIIEEDVENGDGIVSNMDGYSLCWPKLKTLEINDCGSLKYVFPITSAQGLPYLESITITSCSQLKQVFNVAKEKNGVDDAIALPRLKHLHLEKLMTLSCLCSEHYTIISPILQNLIIVRCPQLKRYIQVASLQDLRDLKVSCNRLVSPFDSMLDRNLPQLEMLLIERGDSEAFAEMISIEMGQSSIASSSSSMCHLQSSFPSLESIRIEMCSSLKSLFPISSIPSLSNLKSLEISCFPELVQVFGFGYEGEPNAEDDKKEIVFPELRNFRLFRLPNLFSLAPRGYYFLSPSLDRFEVCKCPKLTTCLIMDLNYPVQATSEASNQFTYLRWSRQKDKMPLYMTVGETKIMVHRKRKIRDELFS